jgi:hypothetical protein
MITILVKHLDMSEEKRPHTVRRYFTQSFCLESLIKYDKEMLLHGEQRSWWDRNHHYPKELSIYQHGSLIRTIKWYINGNIKKTVNTYRDIKEITEYYASGALKYRQNYQLGQLGFVRHGNWSGFYRNGNKHYEEVYVKDTLKYRVRYISNGRPLSGYISSTSNNRVDNSSVKQVLDKVLEEKQLEETKPKQYSDYFRKFLGYFIKF